MKGSVFVKGAPEMLRSMLRSVPAHYDSVYTHHTLQGKRVLAMAWKELPESVAPQNVETWKLVER